MPATATDRLAGLTTSVAVKAPCRLKTTANHALSGLTAVDGVTPVAGDRILVGSNTDAVENGIYVAASGAWSRALDFNGAYDAVGGTQVRVNEGTANGNTYWRVAGDGAVIFETDQIEFEPDLLSDSATLNFVQGGTAPVSQSVQDHLRAGAVLATDYEGVDPTGATDSTAGLLNFFNRCIATSQPGHIPAGTYKVAVGSLLFDNGFVRTQWPWISTDGFEVVEFVGTGTDDEPIIEFRNGTYPGSGSEVEFWYGGHLGGITFSLEETTAGTNRHGIKAYGMWGTHFGRMRGEYLEGSTIHLTDQKYGGSNPDLYTIAYCTFEGAEALYNTQRAFDNQNWQGMNLCEVWSIRANGTGGGVLYGLGAANTFKHISVGSCQGWAVDSNRAGTDPQLDRSVIELAELDDCEYGINLEYVDNVEIRQVRFVHRYAANAFNIGSDDYWPRICIRFAQNSGLVRNTRIGVIHRIDPGGGKDDLGVFVECNSTSNLLNVVLDQYVNVTSTGFTFVDTELYQNLAGSARVKFALEGKVFVDTMPLGGGTVTQGTSKSTTVVLNTLSGAITMHNAALNAGDSVGFTLSNTRIGAHDIVQVIVKSGATDLAYNVWAEEPVVGAVRIGVRNISVGNLSEAIVLSFIVNKGGVS